MENGIGHTKSTLESAHLPFDYWPLAGHFFFGLVFRWRITKSKISTERLLSGRLTKKWSENLYSVSSIAETKFYIER